MKKTNLKIKENITLVDQINAINNIVSSFFTDGEYTPYYSELAKVTSIIENFIEGVEFEDQEIPYDCAMTDEDLHNLIIKFYTDVTEGHEKINEENASYISIMNFIMNCVTDKVDFLKQQIIHTHADLEKIGSFCDAISDSIENLAKLNLQALTPENVELGIHFLQKIKNKDISKDTIVEALKDSIEFDRDMSSAEIVNS